MLEQKQIFISVGEINCHPRLVTFECYLNIGGWDSKQVSCLNLYFGNVKAPNKDGHLYILGFGLRVPRGELTAR